MQPIMKIPARIDDTMSFSAFIDTPEIDRRAILRDVGDRKPAIWCDHERYRMMNPRFRGDQYTGVWRKVKEFDLFRISSLGSRFHLEGLISLLLGDFSHK